MSNKTIPHYLRLHRGSETKPETQRPSGDPTNEFWQAFSNATGWRIDQREAQGQIQQALLPSESFDPEEEPKDDSAVVKRNLAEQLAKSGQLLVSSLKSAQEALQEQEVELAARAAIIQDKGERESVARQLARILENVTKACGCQAATLYTLDDKTSVLNLRSSFGTSDVAPGERTRPLRGSRGDLEAMVHGVVMINNLHETDIDLWSCPQPAQAAICASINSGDVPVGTLWIFADQTTEFGPTHQSVVEMAAREITLVLERAVLDSNASGKKLNRKSIHEIANWQLAGLPSASELAIGWNVDGMIESNQDWSIGWHTWEVLPDGSLMIAMAQAEDDSLTGAMVAATARAALVAHCGYKHSARQIMQRISDTLWQTNTSEQLASLLYLRIDPESGEGEAAVAGNVNAIVANQYGYRPLVTGHTLAIGEHIEAQIDHRTFRIASGETLMAYSHGINQIPGAQAIAGDCLKQCIRSKESNALASLRRKIANTPIDIERGAITVRRS